MIIIDNNQIIIASIFGNLHNGEINENMLRHMVLNTYRMYRNKFKNKYGELVIANDSINCWRKDIFPYYKAKRRKDQTKSKFDWNDIYRVLDNIRTEVKEIFPYKNITVERAEADDIIAILARNYHTSENIMIVSNDKDFQQLQRYPNVHQYSPLKKTQLVCKDPEKFLLDHIIKGDVSDGVPNILSDDDVFITEDKRQSACGVKKIESIKEDLSLWKENKNWNRNNQLINLNMIPQHIEETVMEKYKKDKPKNTGKILSYFMEKKLGRLMENLQEFI